MRFILSCLVVLGGAQSVVVGVSEAETVAAAQENFSSIPAEAWPEGEFVVQLTAAQRLERATFIRDAAAEAGLTNAALIAGIGEVETNFAHCWSEATWACQGPASSTCGGGPVIAGSADGPCSHQQGGLGMFQFDAGTYQQTINMYGPDIVTIEGNTRQVVPFLTERAVQSVSGVNTEQEALDWMNNINIQNGDPEFEKWIYFISWRYNGCKGCTSQENKYRNATHDMISEFGDEFWNSSSLQDAPSDCGVIGTDGATIEEDDGCFEAKGPSSYWREVNDGHGGSLLWTKATQSSTPDNYGLWHMQFSEKGRYEVKVYSDGGEYGQSAKAAYELVHAGGRDTQVVDQNMAAGFISLGIFAFEADTPYYLRLNDNTGEAWAPDPGGVKLLFDAIRVEPRGAGVAGGGEEGLGEDGDDGEDGEINSGCSVGGSNRPGLGLLFVFLALIPMRRGIGLRV